MLWPIRAVCRPARGDSSKEEAIISTHVYNTERIHARDRVATIYDYYEHEAIYDEVDASTNALYSVQSSMHAISTGSFIIERDQGGDYSPHVIIEPKFIIEVVK